MNDTNIKFVKLRQKLRFNKFEGKDSSETVIPLPYSFVNKLEWKKGDSLKMEFIKRDNRNFLIVSKEENNNENRD